MRSLPVRWLLFPSYLAISLLTLVLSGFFLLSLMRTFLYHEIENDAVARAGLAAAALEGLDVAEASQALDDQVAKLASAGEFRITIVRADGIVVADSHTAAPSMENHGDRPEIRAALRNGPTTLRRFSHTLQEEMIYHAMPLGRSAPAPAAIVRVALPVQTAERALSTARTRALLGAAVAAICAAFLGWIVARRFARPMEQMRKAAEHYASGDLSYRIGPLLSAEGERLQNALNTMAADLDTRIRDLARRNREQAALFRSMREGVIAVDQKARVISINPSARELFDVRSESPEGRRLPEVIRHSQLVAFLGRTLDSPDIVETELVLHGEPERYIEAHGAPLVLGDGQRIGALVVLNDVTRQKNMEAERRELVANVSHELRTPVAAIRGYLETLESGALRDVEKATRFVSIASRQTERLSALIEDLLQLAKIEQQVEGDAMERTRQPLEPILADVFQTMQPLCQDGTHIEVECPEDLEADVNADMLERALANLVSNAIRYGRSGQTVSVKAWLHDGWVHIAVADQGEGIRREHLPRLFERFFTVDKARSRQKGGTGLGLSIVKHIARAHRGDVSVTSALGVGSTFTIRFPQESSAVGPGETRREITSA